MQEKSTVLYPSLGHFSFGNRNPSRKRAKQVISVYWWPAWPKDQALAKRRPHRLPICFFPPSNMLHINCLTNLILKFSPQCPVTTATTTATMSVTRQHGQLASRNNIPAASPAHLHRRPLLTNQHNPLPPHFTPCSSWQSSSS